VSKCGIYLISPPRIQVDDFIPLLVQSLSGGYITCFQLNLPDEDISFVSHAAKAIARVLKDNNIVFIINEHVKLAQHIDIDGIHIGDKTPFETGTVRTLRKQLDLSKIIGVSCFNSTDKAMIAGEEEADYVMFGNVFSTNNLDKNMVELELIKDWCSYTNIPTIAVGGIKAENCHELVSKTNVDFIACSSVIWQHPAGPKQAVYELNKVLEEVKK
jgi:thiamine-phosphate pyrophosphorylase